MLQADLQRCTQVVMLICAGIMASGAQAENPPTRSERVEAKRKRDAAVDAYGSRQKKIAQKQAKLANVEKSIEALEDALKPLQPEIAALGEDDPTRQKVEKMQALLVDLKDIYKDGRETVDMYARDIQKELDAALEAYAEKADPKMIAADVNVALDGNVEFPGTPEFMKHTGGAVSVPRYGLCAEDAGGDPGKDITKIVLGEPMQLHAEVSSRVMYETARRLLQRENPALEPMVGRVGLRVSNSDRKSHPVAHREIFGNQSFPPFVINNSLQIEDPLEESKGFRTLMNYYTHGEGTVALPFAGGEITYGLPRVGHPILCNSGGNKEVGVTHRPAFMMAKQFYAHRLNLGASAKPSKPDNKDLRDDAAASVVHSYSGSLVDAVIECGTRWDKDGKTAVMQYLPENFRELVAKKLWIRMGQENGKGYTGIPTDEELKDTVKYPPAMVAAIKKDTEEYCKLVIEDAGTDEHGRHHDLLGTSFSSPVAAGAILAAGMLFPDASEAEIMTAFLASCQPILHREPENEWEKPIAIRYLYDRNTNTIFDPINSGHGEFTLPPYDDGGDQGGPATNSWDRMKQYLREMQRERKNMTRGAVTSVIAPGDRKVERNGQPPPATVELTNFEDVTTDAMKRENAKWRAEVMDAFRALEHVSKLSFMEPSNDIYKHLEKGEYRHAWTQMYEELDAKGLIQFENGRMKGEIGDILEQTRELVNDAVRNGRFRYRIRVPEDRDLSLLSVGLRLKYKDLVWTDEWAEKYTMLESPDGGTPIPVAMSDRHAKVGAGSTTGFVLQSMAGDGPKHDWILSTTQPVKTDESSFIASGSERNRRLGIVGVCETVLGKKLKHQPPPVLPDEHRTSISDPHEWLRKWSTFKQPKKTAAVQSQRIDIKAFWDESALCRLGFLPGGINPFADETKGAKQVKGFIRAAMQVCEELLAARDMPLLTPAQRRDDVARHWGELALAAATDTLSPDRLVEITGRGPKGFHSELRDPDMLHSRRLHRQWQLREGRASDKPPDRS